MLSKAKLKQEWKVLTWCCPIWSAASMTESNSHSSSCSDKNPLPIYYHKSRFYEQLQEELENLQSFESDVVPPKTTYATSFFQQVREREEGKGLERSSSTSAT